MNDLIVKSEVPAEVVILNHVIVQKAIEIIAKANGFGEIDVFDLPEADKTFASGKALIKAVETERVRIKKPILDLERAIDKTASDAMQPLRDTMDVLSRKILAFTKKQEEERVAILRKQEEDRKKEEERIRKENEEKRKAQDEAKKTGSVPPPPPPKPVAPPPPVAIVPKPIVSSAVRTRKIHKLVIEDASKIPYSIGGRILLVPDTGAITDLLKAKVDVPGCKLVEEEVPVSR